MKYRNFLEREAKQEDYMFLPSLGFKMPKVGVMKFNCDSDEIKIHTKELQKIACKICPNKVKYIVGECDSSSSKLYGNGVFCCYHTIKEKV